MKQRKMLVLAIIYKFQRILGKFPLAKIPTRKISAHHTPPKIPPPPENFPPGIFPPISLIVFLHFFSLNTLSINRRRESAHVHPPWMKNFDINLL